MARRRQKSNTGLIVTLVLGLGGAGLVLVAAAVVGGMLMVRQARDRAAVEAERRADRAEAAAAFNDPVPPTPAEAAEFGRFFAALGADLDRSDAAAVFRRFDPDRMIAEMDRVGVFDGVPGRAADRRAFRDGATHGVRQSLGPALVGNELLRWDRAEVRRVRWAADRKEAVVIVVLRDRRGPEENRAKMRWWLAAGPGGWRAYDLEDLDMGSRLSDLMRAVVTPEFLAQMQANPAAFQQAAAGVRTAMAELVLRQDPDAAERALAGVRGVSVPPPLAALRELAEGLLLVVRGEPEPALARYDAAEKLLPGMPALALCRAVALNNLGRHADALEQTARYTRELGPDAVVLQQEGWALEQMGRAADAAAAYGRALDDDPGEANALHGLRRVLPGDKADLTARLAKAPKAADLYDDLAAQARAEGDQAGLKALAAGLAKVKPDDPRVGSGEVLGLVEAGKYAEAAALLKTRLTDKPGKPAEDLLHAYLDAMREAGRAPEAYAAVPPASAGEAFRYLASDLDDELLDADAGQPDPAAGQLEELIAAHRKRDPGDPWLWYYEGSMLESAREYAEAEKEYAAGVAALEKRAAAGKPVGGAGNDPAADLRERLRARRVDCLLELKKGLEAYERVGPADATFRQLAWRYDGADDPAGLAALVDAHEANADPVSLAFWRAEVLYLKKDHRAAAAAFAAYRKAAAGRDAETGLVRQAWDKQVRSLVRAGDVAAARAAAGEGPDKPGPVLAAVVAAAAGDAAAVGRLMDEQAKTPAGVWAFYTDPDFVKLTAGPTFADLLKKHPDPRPKPKPGPAG